MFDGFTIGRSISIPTRSVCGVHKIVPPAPTAVPVGTVPSKVTDEPTQNALSGPAETTFGSKTNTVILSETAQPVTLSFAVIVYSCVTNGFAVVVGPKRVVKPLLGVHSGEFTFAEGNICNKTLPFLQIVRSSPTISITGCMTVMSTVPVAVQPCAPVTVTV